MEASNSSKVSGIEKVLGLTELPDSTFWFFCSIVLAQAWVVYLAYYNSRVLGLIVTAIAKFKFSSYGHIQLGTYLFTVDYILKSFSTKCRICLV